MVDQVLFSSEKTVWETPQDFFDSVNVTYDFNLDVCALPSNTKCKRFFSPRINGLKQSWKGRCWMNPPYGSTSTRQWVEKAFVESKQGVLVVALLPSRTGTRWFHEFIYNRKGISIQFVKGRLKFGGSKNAAPFDSMLVVFYPYHE